MKIGSNLQTLIKMRCKHGDIVMIIEAVCISFVIIDYVKIFVDWYVDYRLEQEDENKKTLLFQ